jgi:hypothetical protein
MYRMTVDRLAVLGRGGSDLVHGLRPEAGSTKSQDLGLKRGTVPEHQIEAEIARLKKRAAEWSALALIVLAGLGPLPPSRWPPENGGLTWLENGVRQAATIRGSSKKVKFAVPG